ncbi:MAG: DUF2339 domain-containing protein [Acidobacteriota bacterium]|nr:DUF2339 domain-containing protein [Acidobacteriota bacterium]
MSTKASAASQGAARSAGQTMRGAPLMPQYAEEDGSLEQRIGSRWLNRVGVVAVLIGVSYFLKLAFDNGWIGPGLRVLIGLAGGAGLCWWSGRFRRGGAAAFSYSLKAVGVGAMYLSLWASFQLYHLLAAPLAFLAMLLVTAATSAMALVEDAELLAGLALLGGMLTPVLCSTGENHEAALFCYLLLISAGAFALQRYKPWPRILLGAFAGTALLGAAWFGDYYTSALYAETLLLYALLFALFAAAPLYAGMSRELPTGHTALVLAIVNGFTFYGAVYEMLALGSHASSAQAFWALVLAALYAGLALALERRQGEQQVREHLLPTVHWAMSIALLTLAIGLRLHAHWSTMAWLVEGGLLFWAASATRRSWPRLFAAAVVLIGLIRLFCYDLEEWGYLQPVFNARLATMALAIAVLLWMMREERRQSNEAHEGLEAVLAVGMVNVIALTALLLEIRDAFDGAMMTAGAPESMRYAAQQAHHGLMILRGFCYSALLMTYGAALMAAGFVRRAAVLRWQAMVLIAITVGKVFLVDTSELEHAWRVLSFIILGAILLAVSYAYQKDWLGLPERGGKEVL